MFAPDVVDVLNDQDRPPLGAVLQTHRRRGHYEGDAQEYRDESAEREWALRDPLARFQAQARRRKWVGARVAEELESRARADVEAAVEFAKASPVPTAELAAGLVYA